MTEVDLLVALGQATIDRVGGVAAAPQPLGLDLTARRDEEYEEGLGSPRFHLRRALDVDLEHQIVVRGQAVGRGRAVQVAEELGVLEEAPGRQALVERGAVDVGVGVGRLARAPGACRPGPAQPQPGILCDEALDHRSLPDPTGAGNDDDHG